MQKLFTRNTPVEGVYFLRKDSLYVQLGDGEQHEIAGENIIVGALEYYLADLSPRNEQRLFDLYVKDASNLKIVPFSTVDRMMREYQFGFNSNIFLSRLLELTNNYYSKKSRQVPKELWQYKLRAQHFAKLTNAVHEFGVMNDIPELSDLAKDKMGRDFYIDGTLLGREIILKAISTLSKPLSEYVIRYKKNSAICREGNIADAMYILLRGKVGVATYGRRAATISEPGEAFGEVALFLDGRRTATLIAEEDTDLYVVKRQDLPKFFQTHRDLFVNIAGTLAKRFHDNIENTQRFESKLKELTAKSADGKGRRALEERVREEVTEFLGELLELRATFKSMPAFDKFLVSNDVKQSRVSA